MADLIKRDSALKGYDTVLSILDSAVNAVSEAKAIVLQYGSEPEPQWIPCSNCARNADNGGLYPDGQTRCPIQEHYALPKDGHCHLAEPWRGEET